MPGQDRGEGGGHVVVVLDEEQSHAVPLQLIGAPVVSWFPRVPVVPWARGSSDVPFPLTRRSARVHGRRPRARARGSQRYGAPAARPKASTPMGEDRVKTLRVTDTFRYAPGTRARRPVHTKCPVAAGSLCSISPQM
ncbi:hypothetical protein GCM10018785_00350 [Streptomyces longispororuber]|uniref:Uncharacterized protein n=1 Tax=Streptomyces longispororuber TaxID=68230 RepID=A0A918Z3G1_9ACTN|nr:hypothetical protein GCM10018785_00350 [Streptomyces longispororuber]